MRIYEELFIVKPSSTDEEIDALNAQLESTIKQSGGKVDKVEKWGTRKLAYRVAKHAEGNYVLLVFHAAPGAVREVERRLRVSDMVLKHITVRMDEKMKWLEKRKKARAARAARKPAPPVAAPAPPAPAPEAVATPGTPAPEMPAPAAPAAPAPAAPAPAEKPASE